MHKNVKLIGCTVVGTTLALLGGPVAQADDASFIAEARNLGFQQWTASTLEPDAPGDALIRLGRSTCRMLQPNLRRLPSDVADHVKRNAGVTLGQANLFLPLAVHEYCPELAYRIGA